MTKIYNPYYIDVTSNDKMYFDSIEDYARYIGPNWYSVSFWGNNTVVNNVGEYFKVVENENYKEQNILKKRDENLYEKEEDIKISIYKCDDFDECKENFKKVYDDFIENGFKSIPLISKNSCV